ncbi:MAG: transcriptional regulator [Planctomycetes bacterium]|nr:transcriptional regulator [Planctomycetota bacterium]
MLHGSNQLDVLKRLKRIEGQIAGIRRMVEGGQYCIDILQQIAAAQGALTQTSKLIIGNHLRTCMKSALESGDAVKADQVIGELEDVFARYLKK